MFRNLHFLRELDPEKPTLIDLTNCGSRFVRLLSQSLLQFFEGKVEGKLRFLIALELDLHLDCGLQLKLVHKDDLNCMVSGTFRKFYLADCESRIIVKKNSAVNENYCRDLTFLRVYYFRQSKRPNFLLW